MSEDQCAFCQEDLCASDNECQFQDFTDCDGNERIVPSCSATLQDLVCVGESEDDFQNYTPEEERNAEGRGDFVAE